MVVVGMRDENGIYTPERLIHDLLTEVGTAVYEQARVLGLHECRSTESLVARVATLADLALAADGGDSTRRASSKKGKLHTIFTSG
jgi:hypothetical protein